MKPIVTVIRPTLTPEERAARTKMLEQAVAAFFIALQKQERSEKRAG